MIESETSIASPIAPPVATGDADASAPKRAFAWFTLAFIATFLLLCGYGAWWWFHSGAGSAPSDAGPLIAVVADSPPGVRRNGRGGGRPNGGFLNRVLNRVTSAAQNGIESTGTGYVVRGSGTYLNVVAGRGNERWQYRFFYSNQSLVTADQQKLIRAMMRANDPDAATKAGVTADQKQRLRKVPPGGMVVQPTQRTQIATLFTAWLTAAGRSGAATAPANGAFPASAKPAQDALVSALSSIAQQQVQPSLQNAADRAKQVHDILGDAEIEKLQ